jgi:hypothetical protein
MCGNDIDRFEEVAEVSPWTLVPDDHPLRPMVDAVLSEMSPIFDRLYSFVRRPSIPLKKLLRA